MNHEYAENLLGMNVVHFSGKVRDGLVILGVFLLISAQAADFKVARAKAQRL